MKKSVTVILVFSITILLLSTVPVSALSLQDIWEHIKNFFNPEGKSEYGGALGTLKPGSPDYTSGDYGSPDYCIDTCESLGYECGIHIICEEEVNCGVCIPGYSKCKNSKCVLLCEDTDISETYPDGINYYSKGRTFDLTTSEVDYCSEDILTEYYCDVNDIKKVNHSCSEDGRVCENGACVYHTEPPPGPCEPLTCTPSVDCGIKNNGCGGTMDCGGCSGGYECVDGTCNLSQVIEINSCPYELNLPTKYVLTQNVSTVYGPCITINSPAELDCQGHSITVAYQKEAIKSFSPGASIKNCVLQVKKYNDLTSTGILLNENNNNVENVIINSGNYGIVIYGNNSKIKDVILNSQEHGIYMLRSHDNFIFNLSSTKARSGVYIDKGFNNSIANSRFSTSYGIYLMSSNNNLVNNSYFQEVNYGIYPSNSKENKFYNLIFNNSRYQDIFLSASPISCNNYFENNTDIFGRETGFYNSKVTIKDKEFSQLILCNADYSLLKNITINNEQGNQRNGIYLSYTDYSILENIKEYNVQYGIYFSDSENNKISDFLINGSDIGIYLFAYSNKNNFDDFEIYYKDRGVYSFASDENNFSKGLIKGGYHGFDLSSDKNVLNNLEISENFLGISLIGNNNSFENNIISDNDRGGIEFMGSYNLLKNNIISGTLFGEGIYADRPGDKNLIIENLILNNGENPIYNEGMTNLSIISNVMCFNGEEIYCETNASEFLDNTCEGSCGIDECQNNCSGFFNSCIDINKPGKYALVKDLEDFQGTCININSDNVILDCFEGFIKGDSEEPAVNVNGNNVSIFNCFIENPLGIGINILGNNVSFKNSVISNSEIGINLMGKDGLIKENLIKGNSICGTKIVDSNKVSFVNNKIYNNNKGICFKNTNNSNIDCGIFNNSIYDVYANESSNNIVFNGVLPIKSYFSQDSEIIIQEDSCENTEYIWLGDELFLRQICGDGLCRDYEDETNCADDCEDFNATISIATLKDNYLIGETIKLTDPPDKSLEEDIEYLKDIEYLENIEEIELIDENILERYILEFPEKPVLKQKEILDQIAKQNKKEVDKMFVLNPIGIYRRIFNLMPEDVDNELKKYSKDLKEKNKESREKIFNKIGNKEIKREFYKVFNGIAVELNQKEVNELKDIEGIRIYKDEVLKADMQETVPLTNAQGFWNHTVFGKNITGEGITIAIIDTGVDYTHEDLGNCTEEEFLSGNCEKVIGGWDFNECEYYVCFFGCYCQTIKAQDPNPIDDNGHGTHVAGTAAGKGDYNKNNIYEPENGEVWGMAPDAKILAYKTLNYQGSGLTSASIAAIERAVDPNEDDDFLDHADIISMSLGRSCGSSYTSSCGPNDASSTAVDNAVAAGVVVVVSAGNSGPSSSTVGSPGTARKAITVGASYKKDYGLVQWSSCTDENAEVDDITCFSSRGPVIYNQEDISKPDIVAPGALICAARYDNIYPEGEHDLYHPCIDDKHVQIAGTSMSTPVVSGAVALIKDAYPGLMPEEIKEKLKDSSKDIGYSKDIQGAGRLDLTGILSCGNNIKEGLEECDGSDSDCITSCSGSCKCLPQSKIRNNKNSRLIGNLILKLQKKEVVEGKLTWTDKQVFNQQVIIPTKGLLKLDTGQDNLGNQIFAGWNNLNISADSVGNYRIYIRFESDINFIEDDWEFEVG